MLLLLKDKIKPWMNTLSKDLNQHVFFSSIIMMVTYYLFDRELLGTNAQRVADPYFLAFALIISWFLYYSTYLHQKMKEDLSKKERTIEKGFFIGMILVTATLSFGYDAILATVLPSLHKASTRSEITVFLILAPIIEEIIYRHLLYDHWSKPKYGKIKGGAIIGLLFVLTHPVINLGGFVLYWIPTLLFFMVYNTAGIKASILVHFLYNLVAVI